MPRLLLIGWDAADWKVIQPLLEAGHMPNLKRLMAQGVHGNVATIHPVLSPMLWTSIATGKRAYKHGIHGFSEPFPDGSGVRPITLLARRSKAVWNILNQNGHRSIVVGWWPSHPAEPLDGVMVSNRFEPLLGPAGKLAPLPPGTIHPASLTEPLNALRVSPMELSGEFIRLFVPEYQKVDQSKDKRLHGLGKTIAETMTTHAAATELLATQPWDFAAVYYSGIDHFEHSFMRYHPPRLPWVEEADFAIYKDVIANAYRYHDAMLGALLGFTDQDTTVILMSDHGFHPDHLRPGYIPVEPAGPAVEHRHFGILCLKGPALRSNEILYGASVLDICPTILALFGLPQGKDMDGKVLVTAFKTPPATEPIESWEAVSGQAGAHPPDAQVDAVASAEAFKQLEELGYVAPPAATIRDTVEECVRELRYNLARSYREGNCLADAAGLAEELWDRWPKEHRFGILLIECLGPLGQVRRRRVAIEELGRRIDQFQAEAKAELAKREREAGGNIDGAEKKDNTPLEGPSRAQFEERQLRELAYGRPLLIDWFLVGQALLEKKPAEARRRLAALAQVEAAGNEHTQMAAGALAQLREFSSAQNLLEAALEIDPENPMVLAQLASVHFKRRKFPEAVSAATESLSLMYFQPATHALLGRALIETNRFAEAEQELRVAAAQNPRNLPAHDALALLYRAHLNRPDEAFAEEGRARSLRHELMALRRAGAAARQATEPTTGPPSASAERASSVKSPQPEERRPAFTAHHGLPAADLPRPFEASVPPERIITVVSGLPRSGTSMMMQLLAAAGRLPLSDGQRAPDEDNPLGYLEFEKTLALAKDASWLPQARGKVVKVVAQLLPFLPATEHYNVVFMERDLGEVIASQQAMLTRQNRRGADLDDDRLVETYARQLRRISHQLDRRPEIRRLPVKYADLLADPARWIERVANFLGGPFDRQAAADAVRPTMRRQKSNGETKTPN